MQSKRRLVRCALRAGMLRPFAHLSQDLLTVRNSDELAFIVKSLSLTMLCYSRPRPTCPPSQMSQDQGSSPTLDSFLQACACAWDRLSPSARRAVRATCQSGRLLHDHLLTQLCIQAGWENEHRPAVGPRAPTPAELHACVHAVLQRGAKLADLSLSFIKSKNYGHLPPREREQQL